MNIFFLTVVSLTILFVLFIPKGMLTVNVLKASYNSNLSFGMKLMCYVPIWNSILIRRSLTGKAKWCSFMQALFIIAFVVRSVALYVAKDNVFVLFATSVFILLTLLLVYITEVGVTYSTLSLFGCDTLKFVSVIPPIAQYLGSYKILPYITKNREEIDGTFEPTR